MVSMNDLFLIYVGSVGEVDEANVCEFYFSRNPDDAIGDGWEMGARDNVLPPDGEWVDKHFRLIAPGLKLCLLEESYQQCYLDGVYGITALAWESVEYTELSVEVLSTLNETMLKFFYGQSLHEILLRLQARGFALELLAETTEEDDDDSEDEPVSAPEPEQEEEEDDGFDNLPF